MAKTFTQMAEEAMAVVPVISAAEAHQRLQQNPSTLVIDVRDAADIAATGTIPGAKTISLGSLTYKADQQVPEAWRDPILQDRSCPIIATCILGPLGAIAGKLLHDMGFTNVSILEGGVQAWSEAGYPTVRPT
ncbi:MAG: sulfurtransferase [Anaerolineae bacterium]|nr:sulfurtransferase [Anaerolineae bacterium]